MGPEMNSFWVAGEKRINILAAALALIAVGSMLYGFGRGEAGIVLQKAIHICLECIGIG
jgi:hypothetical protein